MSHDYRVRPVRITQRDNNMGCDRRRVVAYRGECSCGFRAPARSTHHEARQLIRAHVHAAGNSGSDGGL